jgi:hypothetical protein
MVLFEDGIAYTFISNRYLYIVVIRVKGNNH